MEGRQGSRIHTIAHRKDNGGPREKDQSEIQPSSVQPPVTLMTYFHQPGPTFHLTIAHQIILNPLMDEPTY